MSSPIDTTTRASCWSITINNPTPDDLLCTTVGWNLTGQHEVGEEGTPHFQGMLKTPQVRFSAVKRAFPRAHIEVARDEQALNKYVHKEETRVGMLPTQLNMFSAQTLIATQWDWDVFVETFDRDPLAYIDFLVGENVQQGVRGIEFIGINPIWRSSWKRFYGSIISRHRPTHTYSVPIV